MLVLFRQSIRAAALSTLLAAMIAGAASVGASAQERDGEVSGRAASSMLRPGDQIALNFLRDRDLSGTVTVNERGEAVFPRLGTLMVTPLSIRQLEDSLRASYKTYLKEPELEIAVMRRVAVLGEVRAPNVYMVDATTSLRDVIARAGGVTENGSRGSVVVIREGNRIPVKNWDRPTGQDFALRSGDQVTVGRKNWFVINALSVISTGVLLASFIVANH